MTYRYSWSIPSALYQLRWEPGERRASAVDYLTAAILDSSDPAIREIASGLLALVNDITGEPEGPDENSPANKETENNYGARLTPAGTCQECGGDLESVGRDGMVHADDENDKTHAPVISTTWRADLKLLMSYIPEEIQGDDTYFASNRLYDRLEKADD